MSVLVLEHQGQQSWRGGGRSTEDEVHETRRVGEERYEEDAELVRDSCGGTGDSVQVRSFFCFPPFTLIIIYD